MMEALLIIYGTKAFYWRFTSGKTPKKASFPACLLSKLLEGTAGTGEGLGFGPLERFTASNTPKLF